jgi:ABC-type sugar transport system substrate-binding protein
MMGFKHIIGPVIAFGVSGVLAAACFPLAAPSPAASATTPTVTEASSLPTVITGEMGTADDLQVSDEEAALARDVLSARPGGFILIMTAVLSDYHFAVARGVQQQAANLNLPVEVTTADADPDKAIATIDDAVSRGAKVIILSVFDPAILPALERAAKQGVFIVQYAGRTAAELGAVTVSVEDADLGAVAGDYTGQLIVEGFGGKANVIILDYPDAPQIVVRANAIREALLAAAPEAVILGSYKGGTTDFGYESTLQALADHPEINVVVSINDAGAYGAFQVLTAAGRTPADTVLVGIDGEAQAREYIADGTIYRATVDTDPDSTGLMAINAAIKLLAGSTLPQNIRVTVKLVTAELMPR